MGEKVELELERVHDIHHQIHLLREALQSEKRRLGVFLGAGCPLGIYDVDGNASLKHIPDVAGLTSEVSAALSEPTDKEFWEKLTAACTTKGGSIPHVEHILTQLRTICALKGGVSVDGMTASELQKLDTKICAIIANIVGKNLPGHTNSYHRLAAWIGHIDRISPIELFTPNYDLLVEEALERYKIPFFDGFVGAREPFFDLAAIERDLVPSRWTRLWKLHGSINWVKRDDESVFRSHPAGAGQQLLIYPSHLKYEQSRRMPYLAMIDRLRAFFHDINPVLVVCGYSFSDDHLNEVMLEGLRGNRSAHCFALMYPRLNDCGTAARYANKLPNLTVLALDGAVIGTRSGGYKEIEASRVMPGIRLDDDKEGKEVREERAGPAECLLGDFHHFSLFLETQFGIALANE